MKQAITLFLGACALLAAVLPPGSRAEGVITLKSGEKLPGKRTAAAQLGVSINTVDEAYQMLAAEGYVQARARSGFTVCRLEQLVPQPGGMSPAGPPPVTAWMMPKVSKKT